VDDLKPRPFRIVWALDAFEDSPEVFANSLRLVRGLSVALAAEVEPVYVLGPKQVNLAPDFAQGQLRDLYQPAARRALEHRLASASLPGLLPPRVLLNSLSSLGESATLLAAEAVDLGANLIVTGTHGRQGLSRVLLGSFTEELMLRTTVPVMTVGSQEDRLPRGHGTRRILFATDLDPQAFGVFSRAVSLARALGAPLKLLHAIPRPLEPVLREGAYLLAGSYLGIPSGETHRLGAEQRAKATAAQWIARVGGEASGIEVIIDSEAASVTASILAHADLERTTLIAMAAQSGRLRSALLGSIARQIVRAASHPVWICRPDA
jgi:nucleotide-binding universal stress UspA family protein